MEERREGDFFGTCCSHVWDVLLARAPAVCPDIWFHECGQGNFESWACSSSGWLGRSFLNICPRHPRFRSRRAPLVPQSIFQGTLGQVLPIRPVFHRNSRTQFQNRQKGPFQPTQYFSLSPTAFQSAAHQFRLSKLRSVHDVCQ